MRFYAYNVFFFGVGVRINLIFLGSNGRKFAKIRRNGGLGIRDIRRFNVVLVGKWIWRFLTKENRMWVKIIKSKYGGFEGFGERVSRGRMLKGGSRDLYWGSNGSELRDEFVRVVGNEESASFWADLWVGDVPLKSKFPRIFNFSLQKNDQISDMGRWVGGEWIWEWKWRRYKFYHDRVDMWRWKWASNGIYSSKVAYEIRSRAGDSNQVGAEEGKVFAKLWKCLAPRKVAIIVWKALKERLATKDNLKKRGINLDVDQATCSLCKEEEETNQHLLWLHVVWAGHCEPKRSLLQHSELFGSKNKDIATTIWVGVVWTIWNLRNDVIFNNAQKNIRKIVEEVKGRLWSWISTKRKNGKKFSFMQWIDNPRILLPQ
ncbi:hypothetical protein ACS0TY_012122 [Phlomoides rotata]